MPRYIQQMLIQFNANMFKNQEKFINKMDVIFERMEQRFIIIELSDRAVETQKLPEKLHHELQIFITEPRTEPFTLPSAEHVTKRAPQSLMEFILFTFPQPPPPASKPFIPKMARVAKKHRFGVHNRHRAVERINFRSNFSPRASCSAFIRLNACSAVTPLFSSWTFNMVPCTGQWEFLDHI